MTNEQLDLKCRPMLRQTILDVLREHRPEQPTERAKAIAKRIADRVSRISTKPSHRMIYESALLEMSDQAERPEQPWLDSPEDGDDFYEFRSDASCTAIPCEVIGDEMLLCGDGKRYKARHQKGKWRRLTLSTPPEPLPDKPRAFTAKRKDGRDAFGWYLPGAAWPWQYGDMASDDVGGYLHSDELTNIKWLGDT